MQTVADAESELPTGRAVSEEGSAPPGHSGGMMISPVCPGGAGKSRHSAQTPGWEFTRPKEWNGTILPSDGAKGVYNRTSWSVAAH
jgi:hypothetical protein